MAEEKLERANFYGAEKIISGRGGAAGGSGGGGMGLTGGAYVPAEGGITTTNRWLRFDFNDPNHRSLVILGGTSFTIGENIVTIDETTSYNLSDYISEEGADYYVFINADGRVVANTIRTPADGYMFIGQFHTLCNGVAANTTGKIFANYECNVGDSIIVENYQKNRDLDFTNFYTKTVLAVQKVPQYCAATIDHPLQGFNTGDILPESVWCLNFHPSSLNWDGMVYCNYVDEAADIYLQSGAGINCASEYGSIATVNRYYLNFRGDAQATGKFILSQQSWACAAEGSNIQTVISSYTGTCGGHVDTANRRMISFIGCEDCCGYLDQVNSEISSPSEGSGAIDYDGGSLFSYCFDVLRCLHSGGVYTVPEYSGPKAFGGDFLNRIELTFASRNGSKVLIT